jgi:three-Cys-motif partner protein
MPPKKHPTIWSAAPHTIAKIQILKGYLQAWFAIMGRIARRQDLLYVDGFAGPGEYTNHATGSPIAAAVASRAALAPAGGAWQAGYIHCAFIEPDAERFGNLEERLAPFLCQAAGTAFFFKQWGGVHKSRHGRELFGRTFDEMPGQTL